MQAVPLTLLLREHFFCGDRAEIGRNRPLNRHALRSSILASDSVQQLSPSINVELVGSQEVFGQHPNQRQLEMILLMS